ncbi:hypothetical protein A2630_01000 [Candidatus Woesebacteria bacterium RIFCSPHIGHO2_01_FULL_44_10]|uniref:Prepilin-type N-terminal cleavage/methylation domain-containing protein n=1 Tax=Candidatus Woesebacteria bacterium RIFCSPLOWO2_01_FULL_44_14 TaxID=1802525 RepID=A0A1F8C1K2_9BACT|nr:MAG: hypothetical protein A2630_01000 [Candidatus Woesebacteria bacterium RIFCSPHIGHO2_01_FULL_44_10]OGM54120.1 MAG: hypothetical protein A3F62_05445 [Candidatus Woesebacteria bacterium RIFCSPHIGHO2_12_FULL_44_11]OGM70203.1 MAG: hypothetical protein A2975_03975 [Candidatus Woesebacteria bacterium RIFCSPLOWO2_01_FULL_44_14]
MKKGFTLIELLLYMGLFSMFMVVLTNIFISSLDVKLESQANSAVVADGRFILSRLNYDITNAGTIDLPAGLGAFGSSLQLTTDGETLIYSLDSQSNLVLTDTVGSGKLNSSETKVTAVNFRKIGNSDGGETVRINFTLESATLVNGQPEVRDYQTTVGLR